MTAERIELLRQIFENQYEIREAYGEVTLIVPPRDILQVAEKVTTDASLHFKQLTDLVGIDYLSYGNGGYTGPRFAVNYQLLSLQHNVRLRIKSYLDDTGPEIPPMIDSVTPIWPIANWLEREVFDLLGIVFIGHPDLRRILTDYGFIGHPLRKDFPLVGHVEMFYDEQEKRVAYKPNKTEYRNEVPRVIRQGKINYDG
jgi:NADH-quinone oxidoreductase subunit C